MTGISHQEARCRWAGKRQKRQCARLRSDAPVRTIEARLALAEVRRALQFLPPDQRTTLMLVTVEGLSYKEAADVVGVPVGTIMSRLARARIALHQHLETGGASRRSVKNAEAQ